MLIEEVSTIKVDKEFNLSTKSCKKFFWTEPILSLIVSIPAKVSAASTDILSRVEP